jgi:hypothetical protein
MSAVPSTPAEHEAQLLAETRTYLATYPIRPVEIRLVELVGQHPDTFICAGYRARGELRLLALPVWENEPEEILRGNYTAIFSPMRANIEEEVATRP